MASDEDSAEKEEVKEQKEEAQEGEKKKKKKKKKKKAAPKEKTEKEKFIDMVRATVPSFIIQVRATESWKFIKKTKGVMIYRLINNTGTIHQVKGVGIINCTMDQYQKFTVSFPDNMAIPDDMYDHGAELSVLAEDVRVYLAAFRMPGRPLVSDRVFVWGNADARVDAKTFVSVGMTYTNEQYAAAGVQIPEKKGYVFGELLLSGYMAEAIEGTDQKIKVSYIVQADVKGWLPVWAVNFAASMQALNVSRIKNHFDKVNNIEDHNSDDEVSQSIDGYPERDKSGEKEKEEVIEESKEEVPNSTENGNAEQKKKKKKKKTKSKQSEDL